MNRSLVILAVASLSVGISFGDDIVSKDEVVGIWKVDSSTFRTREVLTPNPFPAPEMPTNLLAVELWLKKDGSFVASNAPKDFFFDSSSLTNEFAGKWRIDTIHPVLKTAHRNEDGTTNWITDQSSTNDFSEISLLFKGSSMQGNWGGQVRRFMRYKSGRKIPSLYIQLPVKKDKAATYEWCVAIRKQDSDDDK